MAARELPVERLVPRGGEVTGVARAKTAEGEAVVIAFAAPGDDPFRRARVRRVAPRAGDDPPWRAAYGLAHGSVTRAVDLGRRHRPHRRRLDDALIREETGGSGTCATYRVIDPPASRSGNARLRRRDPAEPRPDRLYEVTRIYDSGDPHCCPSAIRERVLAWDGARFVMVSEEVTPASVAEPTVIHCPA